MRKKRLPRPTFDVFDFILDSPGGLGGSPKCKKEASGEYQKKTWKKSVATHRDSTEDGAKKGHPFINTAD